MLRKQAGYLVRTFKSEDLNHYQSKLFSYRQIMDSCYFYDLENGKPRDYIYEIVLNSLLIRPIKEQIQLSKLILPSVLAVLLLDKKLKDVEKKSET